MERIGGESEFWRLMRLTVSRIWTFVETPDGGL